MTSADMPVCSCSCPSWAHQAEPPHRCGWCACLVYERQDPR